MSLVHVGLHDLLTDDFPKYGWVGGKRVATAHDKGIVFVLAAKTFFELGKASDVNSIWGEPPDAQRNSASWAAAAEQQSVGLELTLLKQAHAIMLQGRATCKGTMYATYEGQLRSKPSSEACTKILATCLMVALLI